MDLDQGNEIIIFELILTTFETSSFFSYSKAVAKISLSLKSNPYRHIQFVQINKNLSHTELRIIKSV